MPSRHSQCAPVVAVDVKHDVCLSECSETVYHPCRRPGLRCLANLADRIHVGLHDGRSLHLNIVRNCQTSKLLLQVLAMKSNRYNDITEL